MTSPPAAVLDAFGIADDPVPLPGGKGGTWRAGPLVLKPVECPAETTWRADVLATLPDSSGFRIARPARSADGTWTAHGWEATQFVTGATDVGRPDDVLRTGTSFHQAIADRPRPAFLELRTDPWSYGDRVAWAETTAPAADLLAPLVEARRPVDLAAQAVHGDLAGNVLFADGLPPAVIDWPVYWRPPAWASAVVVVDALCWYGAGPDLVTRWSHLPEWDQLLIRALIYRIATHEAAFGLAGWTPEQLATYRPVIGLVLARADAS